MMGRGGRTPHLSQAGQQVGEIKGRNASRHAGVHTSGVIPASRTDVMV